METLAVCLREPSQAASAIALDPTVCGALREQGVGPLVYRALVQHGFANKLPAGVREELARSSREEIILEPFRRDEVRRVLSALAAAGVRALVFKGTALAYTCYPDPCLRPRFDTDLLIRQQEVQPARRVFEQLGFSRALRTSGEHVTHQATWISARHGLHFAFDVHWKLSDPQAFADLFPYGELERDSVPVPALGSAARTPGPEHSLLVACTHRVAHHFDRKFLIDFHDIDLITRHFDARTWNRVVGLAADKRICRVTLRGLDLASELLGTPVPDEVRRALSRADGEPTSRYMADGFRRVDVLKGDLRALGWRGRLTLLREHLFPPPAFVLRSFGRTNRALLPFFYVLRIARGVCAWLRPLR